MTNRDSASSPGRVLTRRSETLTAPVGSGLMSDDPVDRAVAQMRHDLPAHAVTRVPVF